MTKQMTKPQATKTKTLGYRPAQLSSSPKLTIDQVPGLAEALEAALEPIASALREHAYWNEQLKPEATEYRSRDGFIPYNHNCGGAELRLHVPKCESDSFNHLTFGECDDLECDHEQSCSYEDEGYLDAYMRIWLKFEGLDAQGRMEFYLVMEGGNNDAPYFRSKYLPTLFEASFSCRTLAGFKRAAAPALRALLKAVQS